MDLDSLKTSALPEYEVPSGFTRVVSGEYYDISISAIMVSWSFSPSGDITYPLSLILSPVSMLIEIQGEFLHPVHGRVFAGLVVPGPVVDPAWG
jgi:hypothetical protein